MAVLRIDAGHLFPLAKELLGVNLDVGRLTLHTLDEGLVDKDLRMWQRHPHPRVAAGEQDRSPARGHPGAERGHLGSHVLHGVVDRKGGGQRAAGAVDVQLDVAVRRFVFEKKQLRRDRRRHVVVDDAAYENHTVLEQTRVDVVGALAAPVVGDHGRDQVHSITSWLQNQYVAVLLVAGWPSRDTR